jgi:hypothetical protein
MRIGIELAHSYDDADACSFREFLLAPIEEAASGPRWKNSMKIRLSDLTVPHSIKPDRRQFIGGYDARIIMSPDEAALIRLWKEKLDEAEPEALRDNLIVQLGVATERSTRPGTTAIPINPRDHDQTFTRRSRAASKS